MGMLLILLLNMAYRRLLGLKNAFSDGKIPSDANDLDACNNYQLDLNELKNLRIPISIILGSKDRLVDLKAVENFTNVCLKPHLYNG